MSGEQRKKIRILLADDQNVVRQGIRGLLAKEPDFEVVGEVDNGKQAVKLAHELVPDMILMEARMPKLDSIEAIKHVKSEHPEIAILILTWRDEDECVLELLKANVDGYLLKSAKGEDVTQSIRMVNSGQFVCDPRVQKKLLKHTGKRMAVNIDFGDHLTPRESQVLGLAAKRMSNRNIADYLGLTEGTVKGYFVNIFSKMGVNSRTEAVLEAIKRGWISLDE